MTTPRVFAIVPAAGRSARMGAPKLLLDIGGRPMLLATVEPLAAASIVGLVLVTRRDIAAHCDFAHLPGLVVAENEDDRSEMVDSIRIGLRTWFARAAITADDGFLVCPADQPGIATADFEVCIAAFRGGPDRVVVATHAGRRGHPLVFPATLARFVQSPGCDGGLDTLLRAFPERLLLVECRSPAVVRDLDSPEDYARGV